jgi:hypothetical protein
MRKQCLARLCLAYLVCLIVTDSDAQHANSEKPLTNKDIVSMVRSGLSNGVIRAAIEKSKTNFDLSAAAIIELKKSGIPDDLTLAMIGKTNMMNATAPEDTLKLLPAGIYYRSERGYRPLDSHMLISGNSKGAIGKLKKTFGTILNFSIVAKISGDHSAMMIAETKPEFIFVLDYPARNPEEFYLAKLAAANNARQIHFQKRSIGSNTILISDTSKISFASRKITDGTYAVNFTHSLPPGEYAFLYSDSNLYKGNVFKAFDFAIAGKLMSTNE